MAQGTLRHWCNIQNFKQINLHHTNSDHEKWLIVAETAKLKKINEKNSFGTENR